MAGNRDGEAEFFTKELFIKTLTSHNITSQFITRMSVSLSEGCSSLPRNIPGDKHDSTFTDSLQAMLCVYCADHRRALLLSQPVSQTAFHGYLIPHVTRSDAFGRVSWQCNTSPLVPLTQTHRFAPDPLTGGCCGVAA